MFFLLLTATVFAGAPVWPGEWLGDSEGGFVELQYQITDSCEIELVSFSAEPAGLSHEVANGYLQRHLVRKEEAVDLDQVFDAVPEAGKEETLDEGKVLSEDRYRVLVEAIAELGPWSETRTLQVGDNSLVCEFDRRGELLRASFFGDMEDARPLSSLPVQKFRITFKPE